MKVGRLQLARILAERLKSANANELSHEIAAYLLDEKRVSELDSLLRDIQQYRVDAYGVIEAEAVSAFPLGSAVKADIEAKLRSYFPKAKQIILSERLDPELIGGVRLNLANQQLDLSIRSKLNKFKQLTAVN